MRNKAEDRMKILIVVLIKNEKKAPEATNSEKGDFRSWLI